jgi:hypothetical protein
MKSKGIIKPEQGVLPAWQAQVAQATKNPRLQQTLLDREGDLLPHFATHYQALNSLPRRMRRGLQRHWKQSLAGVALLMALGATPALAATIKVGGACTLVNAINAANNAGTAGGTCARGSTGADTIVLPSNSTQLLKTVNNATLYGASGLPTIRSVITIDGNRSTIKRAPTAPAFRILSVGETGALTLLDTTVTGGRAEDETVPSGDNGGGVFAPFYSSGGLTLRNATISGNTASEEGGGIFGRVTLTNSTVSGNSANEEGGGIYGVVTAINSTISNNTGTGVYAGEGADLSITRSTISGNSDDGLSGFRSDVEIIRSTIADNGGDGVTAYVGDMSVTNSTISGNGGDGFAIGDYADLELTHTTVTGNAVNGIDGFEASVILHRSLISGNGEFEVSVRGDYFGVSANDFNIFGFGGNARVEGFTPGPTDIVPTESLEAVLSPTLAANGGPTKTHELPAGSPAIDTVFDGNVTCSLSIDQRGVPRPQDGDGDGGKVCDTGSFERRPSEG